MADSLVKLYLISLLVGSLERRTLPSVDQTRTHSCIEKRGDIKNERIVL